MANHRIGKLLTTLASCIILLIIALPISGTAKAFTENSQASVSGKSPPPTRFPGEYPPPTLPPSSSPSIKGAASSGLTHLPRIKAQDNFSCGHIPCIPLPNVQASGGNPPGTEPANENPIATNPINGNDLLTGANDYNCPLTLSFVGAGFYTSSDRGLTWRSHCMAPLINEKVFGDPGVGYDLHGFAYTVAMNADSNQRLDAIAMERSTDNGVTWSPPLLVTRPILDGGDLDKPWLQVDDNPQSRFANALYVSTTQFGPGNQSTIAVSHSRDRGSTWATTMVDTPQTFPLIDQFSDLAIGKDGTVYVSWQRCSATGPRGDCGDTTATFYLSKSTNGGRTWSTPSPITTAHLAPDICTTVSCFFGTLPNTQERVADIPVIGIQHADLIKKHEHEDNNRKCSHDKRCSHDKKFEDNKRFKNDLHVAFYNWTGSFMQVEVATSTDGGTTWRTPVPVAPPTDTHDQFFPWLSVNEDGLVGVSWLDRRNDPANISYEAFAAVSPNRGFSFSNNIQIADAPSNPFNDGFKGTFMGDYTGNSWFDETLHASWMDSRNGVNMQDEVGGLRPSN